MRAIQAKETDIVYNKSNAPIPTLLNKREIEKIDNLLKLENSGLSALYKRFIAGTDIQLKDEKKVSYNYQSFLAHKDDKVENDIAFVHFLQQIFNLSYEELQIVNKTWHNGLNPREALVNSYSIKDEAGRKYQLHSNSHLTKKELVISRKGDELLVSTTLNKSVFYNPWSHQAVAYKKAIKIKQNLQLTANNRSEKKLATNTEEKETIVIEAPEIEAERAYTVTLGKNNYNTNTSKATDEEKRKDFIREIMHGNIILGKDSFAKFRHLNRNKQDSEEGLANRYLNNFLILLLKTHKLAEPFEQIERLQLQTRKATELPLKFANFQENKSTPETEKEQLAPDSHAALQQFRFNPERQQLEVNQVRHYTIKSQLCASSRPNTLNPDVVIETSASENGTVFTIFDYRKLSPKEIKKDLLHNFLYSEPRFANRARSISTISESSEGSNSTTTNSSLSTSCLSSASLGSDWETEKEYDSSSGSDTESEAPSRSMSISQISSFSPTSPMKVLHTRTSHSLLPKLPKSMSVIPQTAKFQHQLREELFTGGQYEVDQLLLKLNINMLFKKQEKPVIEILKEIERRAANKQHPLHNYVTGIIDIYDLNNKKSKEENLHDLRENWGNLAQRYPKNLVLQAASQLVTVVELEEHNRAFDKEREALHLQKEKEKKILQFQRAIDNAFSDPENQKKPVVKILKGIDEITDPQHPLKKYLTMIIKIYTLKDKKKRQDYLHTLRKNRGILAHYSPENPVLQAASQLVTLVRLEEQNREFEQEQRKLQSRIAKEQQAAAASKPTSSRGWFNLFKSTNPKPKPRTKTDYDYGTPSTRGIDLSFGASASQY